ncbi:hypothetical protein KKF34_02170 [Myxococcota bacterium]|nr:hypothetical protein [Myxococcota bacterium]MBU1381451.1 hypothetical protein [Myxococcota bacterium]MBU1495667.1 hypothetical protein [Myxococcota bacterium]
MLLKGDSQLKKALSTESNVLPALDISGFQIDDHCIGSKWKVENEERLVSLIAIVAMGQSLQAGTIIKKLLPSIPIFTFENLKNEAIIKFKVQDKEQTPRTGYPRYQRDGLIFEIISWIAAKQVSGDNCYLKDPHTSSTSQGLDGLMIELNEDCDEIIKSTIFEDKCTEHPRPTFTQKVIPAFIARHENKRSSDIIAAASTLIKLSGVNDNQAMLMATKIIDLSCRHYRASFALTSDFDTPNAQGELFNGYDKIVNITQNQRIGASLIVDSKLRDWFDALASKIINYIEQLDEDVINV